MVHLPSGAQFDIAYGNQRAAVTEVGAGLRTYTIGERDILDGFEADEMCPSGRGQVLVPWPNRIQDGSYEFEGTQHQLPIDELPGNNAIHGLTRWRPWSVVDRNPDRIMLQHLLHQQPGYPFVLALSVEYVLCDTGLIVTTSATNVGSKNCPYGAGAHPYIRLGNTSIDSAVLELPAQRILRSDERGIPFTSTDVAGTTYDFRQPRAIGDTRLDHAYTDLARDDTGIARVTLTDGKCEVTVWMDSHFGYVMVFSGDSLLDVNRRSIAIEPMTCPPNAFRTGEALISLEPGESCSSVWGISP